VEYVVLNILAGIMLITLRKEMSELAKHYGADDFIPQIVFQRSTY
jgi:hypothetical protein